jgi:hypothetical protein
MISPSYVLTGGYATEFPQFFHKAAVAEAVRRIGRWEVDGTAKEAFQSQIRPR